jgi:ABC-2 type transport system permease protein
MNEGIYWLWLREVIRFWRSRARLASSVAQPIFFLLFVGGGLSFVNVGGGSYQTFMFPGIIAMSLLMASIASGMSVIWDREFGFLKEVLVAPVSRISIFVGKALGGMTSAIIPSAVILLLSPLFGVPLTPQVFLESLAVMFLISMGFVSTGLVIASFMDSFEGFGAIMNFITLPIFFLSGALFPLEDAPGWLAVVSHADPLTYGVDALRAVMLGRSLYPLHVGLAVIVTFTVLMFSVGTWAFSRQD